MGQKVNPIGLRLALNKNWSSRWFAAKANYGDWLHEDLKIRKFIKKNFKHAGISKIMIERYSNNVRVTILAARPGLLIGRKGAELETLRESVAKLLKGREVILDLPAGQDTAVITQAFVKAGSSVSSGTALVEISGRPVPALDLPFGLYRSITPGDRGSDVIAVQKALSDLKLYPRGGIDGIYGTATSRAVEALYAAARVSPPTPDPERTARLRAAQDALRASSAKPGSSQLLKLARARDLAAAAAATPLPANEIVALRGNDLRLVNVPRVGTVLAGDPAPTLRLRGGTPSVTGRVSVLDAEAYADGTKVSISLPLPATKASESVPPA